MTRPLFRPAAGNSRSALVTGASRGIGRCCAQLLAEEGWDLTVSGRDSAALSQAAAELADIGVGVQAVAADMAVEAEVRELAQAHANRFGSLDLLLLSAGVGSSGPVAGYPMRRFDRQIAVNLRGPFALIQECLPQLRQAAVLNPGQGARIVAIASLTGLVPEPGLAVYAATKAALISLCQSVNTEESARGVSATAISPGYVDTEMSAWVRDHIRPADMIGPADIAQLAVVLSRLSPQAVISSIPVARAGPSQFRA